MENKKRIIITILILFVFISVLLIVNIIGFKNQNKKNTVITTTKQIKPEEKDIESISIIINGENKTFNMKNFSTHLGFDIKYDVDKFSASILSNSGAIITNIENSNIYIKVEKLSEEEYYNEYLSNEPILIDDITNEYKFFRGNDIYLKITESYINDESNELKYEMDYMVSTLSF